jgi:hypothetical protein
MDRVQVERWQRYRRDIAAAISAYEAVWQAWPDLDAESVEHCRWVAMAAALDAIKVQ